MKYFLIFLKKELFESLRTYKLLIMGAVFLVFGMIGPLTAKFMPDIMKWALGTDPTMAGMDFSAMGLFGEPSAIDAWAQFYSNVGQMGLIVLVIVFSGMLSSELSKGTLTIMLTKGLPRGAVVMSKLTSAALIWTGSYLVAFLTSWGYTVYLFPDGKLYDLLFAGFCLWSFGVFLLALTTLAATLTDKNFICMLCVGAAVIVLFIIGVVPVVSRYNPASLAGMPVQILAGGATPRNAYPALIVTAIGVAVLTLSALMCFGRRKAGKKAALLAVSALVCVGLTVFFGEAVPAKIRLGMHAASEKVIIGAGTEWELNGILTVPKHAEGKVPAVVLVHGSGAHDMDETIVDNKPFRELAEYLSSNGIAVIRYNMRTLTHNAKISRHITVWEEKMEDALLATRLLRSDPRIDGDRVYILGHSLGGMLAPRIHALGGDYAGIILFAGSARPLIDISKEQNYAMIGEMEEGGEKDALLEEMEQWDDVYGAYFSMSDEEAKNTEIPGFGWAYYWKDLIENPASVFIGGISAPFLIMHAGCDVHVSDVDFEIFQELLAGRDNATFKYYEGLNHLFMPSRGMGISEILDEYRIKANIAPYVLEDIADWIKAEKGA